MLRATVSHVSRLLRPAAVLVSLGVIFFGDRLEQPVHTTWVQGAAQDSEIVAVSSQGGQKHCGWTDVEFLDVDFVDGSQTRFVRDVLGKVKTEPPTDRFRIVMALPEESSHSGWRWSDGLWMPADRSAAYVGGYEQWERWPQTAYRGGCD